MTGRVHFQALAKHDGPGILTRREASHARLYTGNGNDFQPRLTMVVVAIAALLPARPCPIDGGPWSTDEAGLAVFDVLRQPRPGHFTTPRTL